MSKFIAAKILKTTKDKVLDHPQGRNIIGMISSFVGVFFNTLLGIGKVTVGTIFNSISVISDGINNITDTASSAVGLIGFKVANKPADNDHPFGHARVEYISAMIISIIISALGIELVISSIERIIDGSIAEFSIISLAVLTASIIIKGILAIYNFSYYKIIKSDTLKSVALDSLNDCVATTIVILSAVIAHFTSFNADGYAGALVGLLIICQGIKLMIDTCSPLLGEKPSTELVKYIESKVRSYDGVIGIHDMIIHNYGPDKFYVTLHVEIDSTVDINQSHELIDTIERDLTTADLHLVIHMDPINTHDETTKYYREQLTLTIKQIDDRLNIHDFRIVTSEHLIRMLFDIVIPFDFKISENDLNTLINQKVKAIDDRCEAIFNIDKNLVD